MSRNDATVHGYTATGQAIVRLDRAGKWYIEYPHGRTQVTVAEAAQAACLGSVALNRPGGGRFDALVRAERKAKA